MSPDNNNENKDLPKIILESHKDNNDKDNKQPPKDHTTTTSTKEDDWIRQRVGHGMHAVTDVINNNLVVFRYGTVASLALLTAYGVAHTPLFFRYKSVSEIPGSYFTHRKKIRARLIQVIDNDQYGQPISAYVRHLSPAGSLLSKDLYGYGVQAGPSAQVKNGIQLKKNSSDLLKVELAGISAPPFYESNNVGGYQRGEWLNRLAEDNTKVRVELLGRRVVATPKVARDNNNNNQPMRSGAFKKRDMTVVLPELQSTLEEDAKNRGGEDEVEQVAVCRIYYRPTWYQVFATDLADTLVRYGHACVEPEMFFSNHNNNNDNHPSSSTPSRTKIVDASTHLGDLRKDANYLGKLETLEYDAAKKSHGMWSDPMIRAKRGDVVEEVEFQATATMLQRLWRWIRS